jgi:sulfonate transport system ATP-binding protein
MTRLAADVPSARLPGRAGRGATVVLSGLQKSFEARSVLDGIDLEIQPGEFVSVVGPSGSGKSTLLRLLSGLERPSGGVARVQDASGTLLERAVRVVFQEPRLLPWRSVLDNVCIGLGKAERERGREVLARVGLAERANDYPGVLSGGQRQRVALARALLHEPRVLLLDEPFASLDALTRGAAQRLVEELWRQHGFTALLVTHDVEEAVLLSDRVLVLDAGRVRASVKVDLSRPRSQHLSEVAGLRSVLSSAILGSSLSSEAWLGKSERPRPEPPAAALEVPARTPLQNGLAEHAPP